MEEAPGEGRPCTWRQAQAGQYTPQLHLLPPGGLAGGGGGWENLYLPPRACTDIMTGTNHLLGRAHGGKYSLELKPLHKVLIWDD